MLCYTFIMSPAYTHDFLIKTNGETISGEIEFNLDGKMGFRTEDPVVVTESSKARRFISFLEEVKRLYDEFGSIDSLKVTIKE